MPVSPEEAAAYAREAADLNKIYEYIDRHLKAYGLTQVNQISTQFLPPLLAEEVAAEYRKVGWSVIWHKFQDLRDGDFTQFTFSR